VLDVLLDKESGWDFLVEIKEDERTQRIPVLVVTLVENEQKAVELGADGYCVKPVDRSWLLQKLNALTSSETPSVVIIDDDEISRYLIREIVKRSNVRIFEAPTGSDGIRLVQEKQPRLVILDFELPDQTGLHVLGALRGAAETAHVAVAMNTSKALSESEVSALHEAGALTILSKSRLAHEEGISELRSAFRHVGIQI
jgi:DNA-binding response OmpR family regulator